MREVGTNAAENRHGTVIGGVIAGTVVVETAHESGGCGTGMVELRGDG